MPPAAEQAPAARAWPGIRGRPLARRGPRDGPGPAMRLVPAQAIAQALRTQPPLPPRAVLQLRPASPRHGVAAPTAFRGGPHAARGVPRPPRWDLLRRVW